jgi:putative transposase
MQTHEPLTPGNFYHIYNRGIDGCDLFREPENFEYFLGLYDKYISPIAETYAWVLMKNHFHFLIWVKEASLNLTGFNHPSNLTGFDHPSNLTGFDHPSNLTGFENLSGLKPPHQHFSNLFNAYTKAFNKRFSRHGALFERPFKRKLIHDEVYLKQVIVYIHNNPVHHGFCEHPVEYPWSSYLTCLSLKPTRLNRNAVIGWFDDAANFKYMHNQKLNAEMIETWPEL